ncbi:MAG: MarR family transcriptional regulator [Anaerohalosphaera sp.]|nr:MarR family transcriptional regulator [Anaerohalosphaera sp.]
MSLEHELQLNAPFQMKSHEALLNVYFTATCIKKRGIEFLRPYGLTDVQLNLMMLLKYQGRNEGLSQARLSEMMLVNRANVTSLIDRMETAGFVVRTAEANDRRYNIIKLTGKGAKLLDKVEPAYRDEIDRIMSPLSDSEQTKLMKMLETIRANI